MFFIYQLFTIIIILISPFFIVYRILKNKDDKIRFLEKFSIYSKQRGAGKLIWFHGASVGEILSIIPIIYKYENNNKIQKILITSSTLSSSEILKKFTFKKTIHQFYPIDNFYLTNKFLNFWRPNLAIFVESEIWPSMFNSLERKKIPLILLNARITKKTFDKWIKFKKFSQNIFNKITIAYPQNTETKFFLKKLNVKKIDFIGNLKFIENKYYKSDYISKRLNNEFKKYNIWIAASTHRTEEDFCLKSHVEMKKKTNKLITIIIPRHVYRVSEIISQIKNLNLKFMLHSSKIKNLKNIDIYIVDTFGESNKFYKIASSVFLGGSLISRGGQNPLEPARYGAKILHGPNIDNFKDVYKLLDSLNISKKINSSRELISSIDFKKDKTKGMKIKKLGVIIFKKTIKEIDKFINNEIKKT
ncbi:MAG: 3-deoxy-D-manno-octulosonic acid transferase [Pelagibacteraceae bacterium]|nr:3-deoxy-D-manno-octulosonic acid transferase [Pelagibacteraceae bacterium]PHX89035.1 MAG: 3-deoxy-D-manno-octulosonic acid transferase [Pelagibacteraceae bacterium]